MMTEKTEEYEQMLEKYGAFEATKRFYKSHARLIIGGIANVGVLLGLALSGLSVGTRLAIVLALVAVNYIYGKVKDDSN